MFDRLVLLETIWVKFKGQGHELAFIVTGEKCCWCGRRDLEWGPSSCIWIYQFFNLAFFQNFLKGERRVPELDVGLFLKSNPTQNFAPNRTQPTKVFTWPNPTQLSTLGSSSKPSLDSTHIIRGDPASPYPNCSWRSTILDSDRCLCLTFLHLLATHRYKMLYNVFTHYYSFDVDRFCLMHATHRYTIILARCNGFRSFHQLRRI